MSPNVSKNFFLISFLPAFAYWYLEENYPLRVALTAGLALAILEIILEKVFTKHVHTLSKFNFFLILFLGGISLIGDEGIWFKLQPLFTGIGISGFMFYRLVRGKGMLFEMMESMPNDKPKPPEFVIQSLEKHVAIFFFVYALFMGSLAIWGTTDQWMFFKTAGLYIVFFFFMILEFFLMRKMMSKFHKAQEQAEILKRFKP
ncbi:MAG: septation protein IspZ [Bacteriovoracaceae bacterium]|nr:septation protein IspZ [Bacteriovoracaceae bacterium]